MRTRRSLIKQRQRSPVNSGGATVKWTKMIKTQENHVMKTTTNLNAEVLEMTSGDYLIQHYGKYASNLGIIVPKSDSHIGPYGQDDQSIRLFQEADMKDKAEFNLGEGVLDTLRGKFFVSKKGTKLFKVDPNGPHILLRDDWGGAFNSYRGGKLPTMERGALYHRRASSNGGGSGYDYAVVPIEWKLEISEDDL